MSTRSVQRGWWWALVVATVGSLVVSLPFIRDYQVDDLVMVAFLGYALVGAVVARQRPTNPIGWLFLLVGLLASLTGLSDVGTQAVLEAGPPVPWWGVLAAWYGNWFWYPLFMLSTTFTFLLFPNGLPSPRWRPVLWLSVAGTVTATLFGMLDPTLDLQWITDSETPITIANPLSSWFLAGISDGDNESGWFLAPVLVGLLCGVAAVGSVVWRTWRARGVERLQMRLFAAAIVLVPLQILVSETFSGFGNSQLGNLTFTIALTCIPVACGVAVLRYHLYDIDRIIGRTTAYLLVSGALVGLYLLVVAAVSIPLPRSNALQVAVATLVAAAAFRPVLHWARRVVDRRFNRERFDAEVALEQFASRLRDEVDSSAVSSDLLGVLARTVQPSAAGLWLNEPKR